MAKVSIENVRLAFPALWTPQSVKQPNGDLSKPKFGATFLFPPNHPAVAKISAAIQEEAKRKWGEKAAAMLKALKEEGKICMRNGDAKPDYDGFPGNIFLRASSPTKPLVLDANKMSLGEADGKPYGGCYVNAIVEVWAQANNWGKRINATLKGVQFARDGDAFGAGAPVKEDEFSDLSGGADGGDFGSAEAPWVEEAAIL